jgi:hypothetical protein
VMAPVELKDLYQDRYNTKLDNSNSWWSCKYCSRIFYNVVVQSESRKVAYAIIDALDEDHVE